METVGTVSDIRLTMIDQAGTVSFIGPAHGAKVLTAACSKGPTTLNELLQTARALDAEMVNGVLNGLALFDEHNGGGTCAAIHDLRASLPRRAVPPFRVVDDVTRA